MKKPSKKATAIFLSILFGIIYTLGVSIATICIWYNATFDMQFKELLYVLTSPLQGTGQSTIDLILSSCVPPVCILVALYVAVVILLFVGKRRIYRKLRRVGAALSVLVLLGSLTYAFVVLKIPFYLQSISQKSTIYEDYYVSPADVAITADGKTKNLIYIYLESMETTYASKAEGGSQKENYIPGLTALAKEHLSFTDDAGKLGGFHTPMGTECTAAALLSTTSGVPDSYPINPGEDANMSQKSFSKNLITLGDILNERGYKQEFLCGSNGDFGSRKTYFTEHGNYEVYDYYSAIEEGKIPEDYYVWWGYEDAKLYEIAKQEIADLAAGDQPFNFTMLTVDPHHVNGYICAECDKTAKEVENKDGEHLATVLRCADRLLTEFIAWCMEQPFYEDTVIVITGDHPRMDTTLVKHTDDFDRTMYNCIINSDTECLGATTRTFTSFDIFPTTLAAMGFTIEGNQLGFGVNLFSGEATLVERLGYDYFEIEINKYSEFYIREFTRKED